MLKTNVVRFGRHLAGIQRRTSNALPAHVKFLLRHAMIGFSIGLALVVLIIWQDVGRVGTLLATSSQRWLVLGLLGFLFGLTFGSVQMGFAIMLLPEADEEER
jgi:hypothetical protein